jgi:hypothetical protein
MNISPSPEFLAACKQVLGADDPATVLQVLQSRDQQLVDRIREAHVDIVEARRIENSRGVTAA